MYILKYMYSRLSLSRLRLCWITAYLKVKIWSLFRYENLTTGKKTFWKRGEIAPSAFPHNIFNISNYRSQSAYHLWNVVVRFIVSSILQIWYVEVRISRSIWESSLDFEITRVDCICLKSFIWKNWTLYSGNWQRSISLLSKAMGLSLFLLT